MPHDTVIKEIQRDGVSFLRTRFDGTSDRMYVTKRIETATWNCCEERPRSSSRPYRRALPMLTLHDVSLTQIDNQRSGHLNQLDPMKKKNHHLPVQKAEQIQQHNRRHNPQIQLPHQSRLSHRINLFKLSLWIRIMSLIHRLQRRLTFHPNTTLLFQFTPTSRIIHKCNLSSQNV